MINIILGINNSPMKPQLGKPSARVLLSIWTPLTKYIHFATYEKNCFFFFSSWLFKQRLDMVRDLHFIFNHSYKKQSASPNDREGMGIWIGFKVVKSMKRLMIRKNKVGRIPGRWGFNELFERGERGHLAKRHRIECSLCI